MSELLWVEYSTGAGGGSKAYWMWERWSDKRAPDGKRVVGGWGVWGE